MAQKSTEQLAKKSKKGLIRAKENWIAEQCQGIEDSLKKEQ